MGDTTKTTTPTAPDADPKSIDASALAMTRVQQYGKAYNEAKTPAEAERIQKEFFQFAFQTAVIGEGPKVLAEMAKVSPNLVKALAEEIQKSGVTALEKMLVAQADANKKKQEMYADEIDRMYQARLSAADGPAKLMASFKGFAMLLQALCGIDCSNFIKECDERIAAEYAKVPKKDIEGLSKINAYSIDAREAAKMARDMGIEAQKLASTLPSQTSKANSAAAGETGTIAGVGKGAPPANATPSPTATTMKPVATGYVVDAMATLIAEKKLITDNKNPDLKANLQKTLVAAAGSDGDSKTVSSKDLGIIALNTGEAIKAQGGSIKPDEAMALAKQAIERARGLELAVGGPSPRPS